MLSTDKHDLGDQNMAAEYAVACYENMRKQEMQDPINPNYLSQVQVPTEVKDTSRAFLVEWIIDVHRKFRLNSETLYVTVRIIDRFLSKQQIKKSELHILGVTALLISTKYEEIYPPDLKELLQVSENKFSRAQVLDMERNILQVLEFDVQTPSSYRFL